MSKPYVHAVSSAKRFGGIPEDVMQEVFGDDLRVTITRDGKVIDGETDHG